MLVLADLPHVLENSLLTVRANADRDLESIGQGARFKLTIIIQHLRFLGLKSDLDGLEESLMNNVCRLNQIESLGNDIVGCPFHSKQLTIKKENFAYITSYLTGKIKNESEELRKTWRIR